MLNKKKKIQKEIKLWVLLVVACLLRAFSIYAFVLPNNFAPGGITGIATMINYGIDAPVLSWISNTSLFLFLLNIPMVIVSYFAFNRNYAIKTTVAMFLVSGFICTFVFYGVILVKNKIRGGVRHFAFMAKIKRYNGKTAK